MSKPATYPTVAAYAPVVLPKTMTYAELAVYLNKAGCRTTLGRPYYEGGRGMARICSLSWQWAKEHKGKEAADMIYAAFTDQNGNHPSDWY